MTWLPPYGKTNFGRMRQTAYEEMRDIEMSQEARISAGFQRTPHPELMARRDDLWALVRLIDEIQLHPDMEDRLKELLRR